MKLQVNDDTLFTVSIRLSNYLQRGQNISERDAFVMTSKLTDTVNSLHNAGMTASAIDPEHILVVQDDMVIYNFFLQACRTSNIFT